MRRVTTALVLAVFAIVVAGCGPLIAHAQNLSLAFAVGDRHVYRVHLTSDNALNFGTMPTTIKLDLTATETVTVQSVDAAGVADVKVSLTKVTFKSVTGSGNTNSTTTTTTTIPDIELKIGRDGRVLSVNGASVASGLIAEISGGPVLVSAVLPDNAVKPGDTWSKDYDEANPKGSGSVHVTTRSKYLRDETLKGVNAAVIETTSRLTINVTVNTWAGAPITGGPSMGGGSVTIKGTIDSVTTSWIDPSAHRMLKTHMHSKLDLITLIKASPNKYSSVAITSISVKGTQQLNLDPA